MFPRLYDSASWRIISSPMILAGCVPALYRLFGTRTDLGIECFLSSMICLEFLPVLRFTPELRSDPATVPSTREEAEEMTDDCVEDMV